MWILNLDISKDIKEYDGISFLDKQLDICIHHIIFSIFHQNFLEKFFSPFFTTIFSIFHRNFLEKIFAFFCSGNFACLLWAALETSTFALKLICLPGARLRYMDRIHVPRSKTQLLTRSPVFEGESTDSVSRPAGRYLET